MMETITHGGQSFVEPIKAVPRLGLLVLAAFTPQRTATGPSGYGYLFIDRLDFKHTLVLRSSYPDR